MSASVDDLLKERLSRFGREPDGCFDLEEAALCLGALASSHKDCDRYRQMLNQIAKDAAKRARSGASAAERGAALADTLAGRWLFCAEEEGHEEPDNATLMHLLDQRCGASIVLGVLWIVTGRRLGWRMEALSFPYRFLVRIEDDHGGREIVDPVAAGETVNAVDLRAFVKLAGGLAAEPKLDYYKSLNDREILTSLLDHLKAQHLHRGDIKRAAADLEFRLLIAPCDSAIWRDLGMMQLRMGRVARAIEALETFIASAPYSEARRRVESLIRKLRQ